MEKIDITKTYAELDEAIKIEDHDKAYQLSDKLLKADPKDNDALQCKIVALVNMQNRNEEIINIIEKSGLQKEFLIEYAYALHEGKRFDDSTKVLVQNKNSRGDLTQSINELLAQNYYRMGRYEESYYAYKDLIENRLKDGSIEEERELISNFLAAYSLSGVQDQSFLDLLTKFLNSWEAFYNYSIICLKKGNYNECLEITSRMDRDFPKLDDEFNELKNVNIHLNLTQSCFDGFELNKITNISEIYEKVHTKVQRYPVLQPFFFNNQLHFKKDKEGLNEIIKKYENYLKNDSLSNEEKETLTINKIILLLRANKFQDAQDLLKTIKVDYNNSMHVIIHCFLLFKLDKGENWDDLILQDQKLKSRPEPYLVSIQLMLSSINAKNIEKFHLKVLNFIKQFYNFTLNYHFLNFFIGFYEGRHLKDYLKEFLRNYKDTNMLISNIRNNTTLKKCIKVLGKAFYSAGLYEESSALYSYIVENLDKADREAKIDLIQSIAHVNTDRSEEIRRQVDDTMIDLSADHLNNLLTEVFSKFRKNQTNETKKKKKKNKKVRYPKNFDPKKPGPMPDPERWLPKLQRKKYRNIAKNKLAYQGATADHTTTTSKFNK